MRCFLSRLRSAGQRLTAISIGASITLTASFAQADCSTDAMIVFDGSGSMAEMGFNQIDEPRIFEARRAVRQVMPQVALNRRIGLIVYGPDTSGQGDQCSGIDLKFPPLANAAGPVIGAIDDLEPEGQTALTEAVRRAAQVLDHTNKPGTIVLVTDGKETCGGQTCALAAELAASGLATTVHVIGFKVRGTHFGWQSQGQTSYNTATSGAKCLATRTGGEYVSTETVEELIAAMQRTLGCALLY
ncbi:vWA domain-containing protein [Phaeobacter gallaeciensis]|uniref:Mg-chelatase subunit ChlD n=1 Tax=Phaeobacter gallaeciensis TaxID=60890 RepID=A0AAC9ZD29_9RHOB|nr:VWA domain-containing protein [Phaeobacter gallaeciensis]AHD11605.1 Mg-chelatase subunit ChlD [Phaeobacter gallaeciensis DSM 26640]ATE94869.1 Mg-chelatase subunit ChlD [Phaeobacter gallaeciensis]ATE99140.1 Mg-chelatase subunit ChlD [Phaeobacter gallaeciensis]ATF03533.1 Mg-chelatase subunit ChlD [Phaeobacter gallaeciensis]ATF07913.1 Mg-chelatase subunit ChlD [Phaeobacter gallaeciensis]